MIDRLRHVVVWVTKMDDFTVQFDSARYEEIKKAMVTFLKEVGYKLKDAAETAARWKQLVGVDTCQG